MRYNAITPARLSWQGGAPFSEAFSDVYFSSHGGMQETQHVFIDGNDLKLRFSQAKKFVIGETGFGSGLNFLVTVKTWLEHAAEEACLDYISIEQHPFTYQDLKNAQSAWSKLQPLSTELLASYPELSHGFHRCELFNDRVRLTLLFGDANELLPELTAEVDAWFLDGFAPAKNQSLWSEKLFKVIADKTAAHGSFATYTAAGNVRRGLQAAGFEVSKRPGYGRKRDMLCGCLHSRSSKISSAPWYHYEAITTPEKRHAVVIGAGMAGITSAVALAKRGWQVRVIEQAEGIAGSASGNPGGVVMPKLTADMSIDAQFFLAAFLYAQYAYGVLQAQWGNIGWHPDGVLQLLDSHKRQAFKSLRLPVSVIRFQDQHAMSVMAGMSLEQGGACYGLAGWLEPKLYCQTLLQHFPAIDVHCAMAVDKIAFDSGEWQILQQGATIATAPVLIIAGGDRSLELLDGLNGLQSVRGQLTLVEGISGQIKCPVCYDGYSIPLGGEHYCVGAGYDRDSRDMTLRESDQQTNLRAMQQVLQDFQWNRVTGGRVAFRATTIDRMPMIGPVADVAFYQQHYADLYHGRPAAHYPLAQYQPGLYLNTGHGSRGLTSCPLAAELLASMIQGAPLPVAEDTRLALHPARFLVRKLRRSRPAG